MLVLSPAWATRRRVVFWGLLDFFIPGWKDRGLRRIF